MGIFNDPLTVDVQSLSIFRNFQIESLVDSSDLIENIQKIYLRTDSAGELLYKQTSQIPNIDEHFTGTGLITEALMLELFDSRAPALLQSLRDRKYCQITGKENYTLTWKFRDTLIEDFSLGFEDDDEIYEKLNALLWAPLNGNNFSNFIAVVRGLKEHPFGTPHKISDSEYWFRYGTIVIAVRFSKAPPPEAIDLINLKIQTIQHEQIQTHFKIASTFNTDALFWNNLPTRNRRFFPLVESFLVYIQRLFDLKSCDVSINAVSAEKAIVYGSLHIEFSDLDVPTVHQDDTPKRYPESKSTDREYSINNLVLTPERPSSGSVSYLNIRLLSRSSGNLDFRGNTLAHKFIVLLIESVGRLIDFVIPIVHRDEVLTSLNWRSFIDTQRLKAMEKGEDIHLILTDFLKLLIRFYKISDVLFFSEDREIDHMLHLFSDENSNPKLYKTIDTALTSEQILKGQYLLFPLQEFYGNRILLYFKIPTENKSKNNPPKTKKAYLKGTEFWNIFQQEAEKLKIDNLGDTLFFLVTECLSSNPKVVLENLAHQLPHQAKSLELGILIKLVQNTLKRFNRFLDIFNILSSSIESGMAYMRGRRDNLTGLYNRQHFKQIVNKSFSQPRNQLGLMFLDMDNFKIFNDSVSHDFGDKVLSLLASRMLNISKEIEEISIPCRFGGDEFCVFLDEVDKNLFEKKSVDIFKYVTETALPLEFYFENRQESHNLEINIISFLHRLMRPDVGTRQVLNTDFTKEKNSSPRNLVLNIWKYNKKLEGSSVSEESVDSKEIVEHVLVSIKNKILLNKILPEVDSELEKIIRIFVQLQTENHTTDTIRESIISHLKKVSIQRNTFIQISCGLSHSSEDRVRSIESLFSAADGRAYLAKHNGKNCLFGVEGHQLT